MLRVGITEVDIAFEDKERAKENCIKVMETAKENGVELLVFPEMTLTGYTMMPGKVYERSADGRYSDSVSFFMEQSRRYNMAMAFGYIDAVEGDAAINQNGAEQTGTKNKAVKYMNKLAVVQGEDILLDYAKIHPFSYSNEHLVYRGGDRLCQMKLKDVRIGGYICYDLRFPEIFSAARDKYEAILVIANWPQERVLQWEALLKARAIENQAYVIAVNRTGVSGRLTYVPSSHIYDQLGCDIAKRVDETLLIADLDGEKICNARKLFPQERDRKNELYRVFLQ